MTDALFDLEPHGPYRMQWWSSRDQRWHSMDEGPAASHWKPRPTLDEAVQKCYQWTGAIMIPVMQAIDLSTGEVVWRNADQYPDAGESIPLPNETIIKGHALAGEPGRVGHDSGRD